MNFTSSGPQPGAIISGKAQVTSASFHADGSKLFVASESDSRLHIIDCQTGKQSTPALRFEREGVSLVESTHHNQCTLVSGNGSADQQPSQRYAVNYHSTHDNKILRKFRGHDDTINNISMSPADDSFLTSSRDRTVRLWSLQQAGAVAKLELPTASEGEPFAAFDSTGLVFGITAAMTAQQGHYIHLYDARNYSGGAFAEMKVTTAQLEKELTPQMARSEWTSMKFNASGNQILVTGKDGLVLTLDGYEGTVQRSFTGKGTTTACWTPDDKTVLTGADDGTLSCWNADTGALIKKLERGHNGPISWVGVNPKYSMFASCDTNTTMW
eukprot:CAMPEP_0178937088 /NCGR_PEP_ID=MMETSP0786-20121207/25553_1 /TAXON_ID=186022 /ORGANISM="Thalassionema frauenfeldii, Strain CCMP 1798" /LENGTH=326 /DNA_ID=CAMNT_0020615601 /DNA_START=86 /DNA_END=1063 /DNA_ORIENTATION=+